MASSNVITLGNQIRSHWSPGDGCLAETGVDWPEHGFTHVDAPCHMIHGDWTLDYRNLNQLCGEAGVIAYVQAALRAVGAKAVYNLKGGIFALHNERRGLVNAKGPTEFVHPYDRHWGRLVERRHLTRHEP